MDDKAARGPEPEEDFLLNDPLRVLTPLGRKQAAHTGEALAAILANDELKRESTTLRVYSSDMARAAETGRIVHGKLKGLARGFPRGEGGEDGGGEGGGGKDGGAANPARAAAEAPLIVDSLLREGAPVPPEGYRGPWKPQRWEFYEEGARSEWRLGVPCPPHPSLTHRLRVCCVERPTQLRRRSASSCTACPRTSSTTPLR